MNVVILGEELLFTSVGLLEMELELNKLKSSLSQSLCDSIFRKSSGSSEALIQKRCQFQLSAV